jgi:hypothetical protein
MRLIGLAVVLTVSLFLWTPAVEAQQTEKAVRIGLLDLPRPIRPESHGGRPFESGSESWDTWKGNMSPMSLAGARET